MVALWQSLPCAQSARKGRKLDVLGLFALSFLMASFLLFVDSAGKDDGFQHSFAPLFAATFVAFAVALALIESYYAENPLISPALIAKERVGPYYAVQTLLLVAQFGVSLT